MWYRGDKDQIRFSKGTMLSDVAIIPKYPLFDIQAPPENMVPNQAFEIDRDEDNIPDNWSGWIVEAGSGSRTKVADPAKGGFSLKITADTITSVVWATSDMILVSGNKKYYGSVLAKCQYASNDDVVVLAVWWDVNKSWISNSTIYGGSGTTAFSEYKGEVTSPANARYCQIYLGVHTPATAPAWVEYDDVVFSEMRAAVPTAGVVGGTVDWAGTWTSCPYLTWTSLGSFTVPNVDHEVYFVQVTIRRSNPGTLKGAVRLKIGSTYYPIADGSNGLSVFCYSEAAAPELPSDGVLFTLPFNAKGLTVYVEYRNTMNLLMDCDAGIVGWGHSPHTHR
jgi:hypothetical protein